MDHSPSTRATSTLPEDDTSSPWGEHLLGRAFPSSALSGRTWMARHKKSVTGLAAGLVLIIVLAALVLPRFLNPTPTVTVYTVHVQALNSFVGGGGVTYPSQQITIVYPVNANVGKVNVQVGQQVKAGQVLMTLNSADLAAQLQRAQAQVQAAQAYLNSLENGPQTSSTPSQIASAQAQLQSAQGQYNALAAQLNSAQYSNGNIIAPFAGVVTSLAATPGAVAPANTTLLTLANLTTIIVKVQFPIDQRGEVQLNQTADIYPAAAPDQHFTGTITTINPNLTSTGADTFETWVTVQNPSLMLFNGETMYARVQTQVSLPSVPEVAVVNPDADSIVFVYGSDGRAHLQHVVVGLRDGTMFGITSGLQEGDQIILVGQFQLTDNEAVKVRKIEP